MINFRKFFSGLKFYNYQWKEIEKRFGGAVCIPASCPSSVVEVLMKHLLEGTKFQVSTDYDQELFCSFKEEKELQVIHFMIM